MIEIYQFRDFVPPGAVVRTCYSCRWSIGTTTGLSCKLGYEDLNPCNRYDREMWADEPAEVNGES